MATTTGAMSAASQQAGGSSKKMRIEGGGANPGPVEEVPQVSVRHPVVDLLCAVEQDEGSLKDKWLENAAKTIEAGSTLARVVEVLESTPKSMSGNSSMFDVHEGLFVTNTTGTQVGKTKGGLNMLVAAALQHKLLPVVMVQNSTETFKRFKSAVEGLNNLIYELCRLSGIDDIPRIELFGATNIDSWTASADAFFNGDSLEIPIFAALGNNLKVKLVRNQIFRCVSMMTARRDAKNRLPIVFLNDEADQWFKTEDRSSKMEEVVSEVVDFGRRGKWSSFEDAVSTVVYITATQAAIAINRDMDDGRKLVVIEQTPSVNYWGFGGAGGGQKEVERVFAVHLSEMTDAVVTSHENRAALILEPTFSKIDEREKKAGALAIKYAAEGGIAVMSWSADVITVNTAERVFIDCLDELDPPNTKKKSIACGVFEYKVKKGPYNSYRSMLTALKEHAATTKPTLVRKFFLYADKMVDRGVNVRANDHDEAITDLFVGENTWSREKLLQAFGRICGNCTRDYPRKVWASAKVHGEHERAIADSRLIIDSFYNNGVSLQDDLSSLWKAVQEAPEGAEVEDRRDVHATISRNMTRPGANQMAIRQKRQVDDALEAGGKRLRRIKTEATVAAEAAAEAAAAAAAVAAEAAEAAALAEGGAAAPAAKAKANAKARAKRRIAAKAKGKGKGKARARAKVMTRSVARRREQTRPALQASAGAPPDEAAETEEAAAAAQQPVNVMTRSVARGREQPVIHEPAAAGEIEEAAAAAQKPVTQDPAAAGETEEAETAAALQPVIHEPEAVTETGEAAAGAQEPVTQDPAAAGETEEAAAAAQQPVIHEPEAAAETEVAGAAVPATQQPVMHEPEAAAETEVAGAAVPAAQQPVIHEPEAAAAAAQQPVMHEPGVAAETDAAETAAATQASAAPAPATEVGVAPAPVPEVEAAKGAAVAAGAAPEGAPDADEEDWALAGLVLEENLAAEPVVWTDAELSKLMDEHRAAFVEIIKDLVHGADSISLGDMKLEMQLHQAYPKAVVGCDSSLVVRHIIAKESMGILHVARVYFKDGGFFAFV